MKKAQVSEFMQIIFNEYTGKITNSDYCPNTPLDTLRSRITATWLLKSNDPGLVEKAEIFIKKTSVSKKEDLDRLKTFSDQVRAWNHLEVCSIYTNSSGLFIEYKLNVTTTDNEEIIVHHHAVYGIQDEICCFISQTSSLIRIIGDPVLHQPGMLFPENPTIEEQYELKKQIEHAKAILIQTGGAGIAANQCIGIKVPYQFAIVGIFYDIPEHVEGVGRRYPAIKFPKARIMINPTIISYSNATQYFNHACLSIPSPNRCCVKSPEELTVSYHDPEKNMAIVTLSLKGVDAIVLWHELTHILDGKTYMDIAFESLTPMDLSKIENLIADEQKKRKINNNVAIPELTVPPFYLTIKINSDQNISLEEEVLRESLTKMTSETLEGIMIRCQSLIKK